MTGCEARERTGNSRRAVGRGSVPGFGPATKVAHSRDAKDAMASLPEHVKELIDRNVIVHLATLNADGSPQVTPVWITRDGDLLQIGSAEGRVKVDNLRRDPRLAISFTDPEDPTRMVAIKGRAVAVEHRGWDLIDELARKYRGSDGFGRFEGMVRVDIDVEVDSVVG